MITARYALQFFFGEHSKLWSGVLEKAVNVYRIPAVIHSALIFFRSKTNEGLCQQLDVNSHKVTLNGIISNYLN